MKKQIFLCFSISTTLALVGGAKVLSASSETVTATTSSPQQTVHVHKADAAKESSHLLSVEDRPGPISIPCFGGPIADPSQAKLHCAIRDLLYLQTDMTKRFATVAAAVKEYGVPVRKSMGPIFTAAGVPYPPKELTFIALKNEKQFYVFSKDEKGHQKFLKSYPIIGMSGGSGPKLREGDKQVPEGFYKISELRPMLVAHMGLAVDYPNAEDRAHARAEKRTNPGSDILIHGSLWSSGCLAMGNPAIHELFILAYDCGYKNVKLIFAPCNLLLTNPDLDLKKQPKWLPDLYAKIQQTLKQYPIPAAEKPASF